jgi:hypothetical protein
MDQQPPRDIDQCRDRCEGTRGMTRGNQGIHPPVSMSLRLWHPPRDPVRRFALVGCLNPPDDVKPNLSAPTARLLEAMAQRLRDEAEIATPIDYDLIDRTGRAVNLDLSHHGTAGHHWLVENATTGKKRRKRVLYMPALWGVEHTIRHLTAESYWLSYGERTDRIQEAKRVEAARFAGEELSELLAKEIRRASRADSRPIPSLQVLAPETQDEPNAKSLQQAWRNFDYKLHMSGCASLHLVEASTGRPNLRVISNDNGGFDGAA